MSNSFLDHKIESNLGLAQVYKTKIRQFVLSALSESKYPLSSLELYNLVLAQNLECDRSTIYRQLDKLVKENLILELDLMDGKKRYEIKKQNHHHHLICNNCKKAICITLPENSLEQLIILPIMENGFTITSHILEFFGVCRDCKQIRD